MIFFNWFGMMMRPALVWVAMMVMMTIAALTMVVMI